MLEKSRGIVFSTTDYGETSLIARIYTERFGLQSYIIGSVRKRHAKIHSGIFQPLTPVELVAYHKDRPVIHRLSDIRPDPLLTSIPFNVQKSALVFFLNEILVKSIREEEANPSLFEFLFRTIIWLDDMIPSADFHLIFLIKLSRHLGFSPSHDANPQNIFFDLKEGKFINHPPNHPYFLTEHLSQALRKLMNAEYGGTAGLDPGSRRMLLNQLLDYYQLHIEGFGNFKSHKVLEHIWETDQDAS
jgi:DNA repair protein RecO (recombination protein O)